MAVVSWTGCRWERNWMIGVCGVGRVEKKGIYEKIWVNQKERERDRREVSYLK